jgi:hypothetical protein
MMLSYETGGGPVPAGEDHYACYDDVDASMKDEMSYP